MIKTLNQTPSGTLYRAFQEAFRDYPLQLSFEEFKTMLHRRGYTPELSFGWFENDRILAFILNGTGMYKGLRTVYDTGTGTVESHRGKGYASAMLRHIIPLLQKQGFQQYLLEVLQENTKAVSLYKKQGFGVSRALNYFSQLNHLIQNRETSSLFEIRSISIPDSHLIQKFHDFEPAWQNRHEAVDQPKAGAFRAFGAFLNETLRGYCILDTVSGDLAQLAVHPGFRRKGAATLLMQAVLNCNQHITLKVLNTDSRCASITHFLTSLNIPLRAKQYEMTLSL